MAPTSSCQEHSASPAERINPWSNPKLTIGEAFDIQIKECREQLEQLCVKKAKLEAMDWLNHPYYEVQRLMSIS